MRGLGDICWFPPCAPSDSGSGESPAVSPDTYIDPATGCLLDTDGNVLKCPAGIDPYQQIGEQVAAQSSAPPLPSYVQQQPFSQFGQQFASGAASGAAHDASQQQGLTWDKISNWVTKNSTAVALGAVALALVSVAGGGRRRR